nr:serine/threonine-protein kinase pakD isoform X3 [Helicoverpa armigera]
MKRLLILGAVWALAVARPEQYKEQEDFQYSRSSSDDGTKSGYYGAQRGNMGGNYERAHNMDSLAQNQMSGLVKQVEGELGDGANTKAGSVYTAANSRGIYGSSHSDLSNLAGRNFQEGETYGSSASHQSSSSAYNAAAYNAAAYNSRSHSSRASGYQATGHSGLNVHSDDLQSVDNTQGTYGYGRQSSHSAGYNAQAGYQQHTDFDASNANLHSGGYGSNVHTRLISATPVRIVGRPGMRVAIPIAAQTYDITHGSSLMDQNSLNSDAEVLNTDAQHTVYRPTAAKHYESSFNYRKKWEKHDTIPSAVFVPVPATSTENPFPKNSELYEDSQAHTAQYDAGRVDSQRAHSSNVYSGYDANVKSTSGQSRLNYNTQHTGASTHDVANAYTVAGYNRGSSHHNAAADLSSHGYNTQSQYNTGRYQGHAAVEDASSLLQAAQNSGYSTDLNSQVESLNTKPKSYQSSYSYHKSWERQGDPYVIKPASAGYYDASSQRLTAGTASGSHYQHSHHSGADCDENGHIRVARSYNADQFQDMQQQSQNLEDLGQQVEDLGQQTQVQWGQGEDVQQVQNTWDNLEDLSQQSHNKWDDLHQAWDKFEDMGQKPQDVNTQISNLEQNNQNDLGRRRQENTSDLKNNKQDQEAQNEWEVTSQTQEEKENMHNQHHEQTNEFDQQVNQPGTTDDDVFSQYFQISNKPHSQMSVWDKLDFGSFQNVEHNKKEDVNSNDQQVTSSSISQHRDLDQLPVNTANIADLTQSEHHNVNYNSGDESVWHQINTDDAQPSHKLPEITVPSYPGHYFVDNGYSHSQHQFNHNQQSFQQSHSFHENHNWNSYASSHRHEQTTNTESLAQVNAFGVNSQNSPLSSIWGKLDNVEQFDKEDNSEGSFTQNNTQNAYENSRQVETQNTGGSSPSFSQDQRDNHMNPFYDLMHHINEKDTTENNPKTSKESSSDAGRGDIGPEVISDSKPYQHSIDTPVNVETHNNNQKPKKETDLPDHELSVLGLHEQKPIDQNKQNGYSATNTNKTLTQNNYQGTQRRENENWSNLHVSNENLQQQNNIQQSSQQHNKTEQQSIQDFSQQENMQDFGQQANLDQENLQEFLPQTSLEQQNLQNLGQQANLEQQNLDNFGQHSVEQNKHDFSQQVNLDQQDLHDFGHQASLEQQNLQDFGQHENLEQQNLQDFSQQVNLDQQNLHDFGQQASLEQQNLQDFGQHENLEQQNLQNFGQHENLEQQNQQDFSQQVNLDQQNLHDFGQQANLEQQNLQDFGQHENLEQQNLHDFGQHENSEQQNLQDFGQHENLEQQSLQDFGQHENLEQQNVQDFGQQVNQEQQNLQDFGQQAHLEQHNLHHNLEQQNLQDFGQQAYLEQQNLESFSQHENLEHTHPELTNQNLEKSTHDLERNSKYTGKYEHPATYFPPSGEVEDAIVKKQNNDLQAPNVQNPGTEIPPQMESVTEKAGFWKSIGNKLSKAKTKIASWF